MTNQQINFGTSSVPVDVNVSGSLNLAAAPTTDLEAATKKYVDDNKLSIGTTSTTAAAGNHTHSGYATADTKNTTGSTDTSSKIYLVGATSQAANPVTYSDNEVYTTSGVLTTKKVQVGGTAATIEYDSTNQCINFVFA